MCIRDRFIQWLHEEDKEYLFLTNNSGYTPRELNQKLARMGLDVPEEHFYTSELATAAFLREQAPGDVYKRQPVCCRSGSNENVLDLGSTLEMRG